VRRELKRIDFNVGFVSVSCNMGLLSWLNELFKPPQEYGIPSVTLTGQHVRSKGERVIADYFTRHSITYNYEAMATTNDWFIFKSKISRPDFYLP